MEAAFLTAKISKLVLYEPPLQELDHSAVTDRMETMIRAGQREQALTTFMLEIVHITSAELAAMKARPSWPGLVARDGPANLDSFRGRDKWNSVGYAAAASG